MKRIMKKSLSIALLISAFAVNAAQVATVTGRAPVVSLFKIRPQSLNGARKVAGEAGVTHLADKCEWYSNFSLTPEYQRTFRSGNIAHSLFDGYLVNTPAAANANNNKKKCNKKCSESILIQGTNVANRSANAWRAEDFYLSSTYDGALSFNPTISNFILDFNFYGGLSNWAQGLYFRVYAPYVHTKWNLNMKENIVSAGNTEGFDKPFAKASEFFAGATPGAVALQGITFAAPGNINTPIAVTRNPLAFDKMISTGKCAPKCTDSVGTRNGFGEIRGEFGWDFWQCENHHIGAYIAAAAPTGTKPKARFLFEPLIGNGKHWELGAGVTAHWSFWNSECENHRIGMYLDGMVTHLFASKEHRTFDLKNKSLSRYMQAANMVTPVTNGLTGVDVGGAPTTAPSVQFGNVFTPVANLTTQDVNVSVGAQVDLTAWFNYTGKNFNVDLGYNLWLQTCEKFKCVSKCGPRLAAEKDTWVLVGNANAYGSGDQNPQAANNYFVPLSFSESTATINSGGALDNGQVAGLDNPAGGVFDLFSLTSTAAAPVNAVLSNPPVFINAADIDMNQRAKALSNKIFANVGYTWECDRENMIPMVSIGGEVEFGSGKNCPKNATTTTPATTTANNNCKKSCTSCIENAVSQWGVWAKFNIAFN